MREKGQALAPVWAPHMWKENKVELGRRAATLSPLSFLPFRRVSLLVASVNFLLLLLLLFFFFLRPGGRGSGSGRGRGSGSGRGRGRSRGRGGRYRHRNGMVVLCCFSWFKDRGPSPVHSATPAPGRGPSPVHSARPAPRPASSSMCDDSADDPNDWCLCRGTFMDDSSEEPISDSPVSAFELEPSAEDSKSQLAALQEAEMFAAAARDTVDDFFVVSACTD